MATKWNLEKISVLKHKFMISNGICLSIITSGTIVMCVGSSVSKHRHVCQCTMNLLLREWKTLHLNGKVISNRNEKALYQYRLRAEERQSNNQPGVGINKAVSGRTKQEVREEAQQGTCLQLCQASRANPCISLKPGECGSLLVIPRQGWCPGRKLVSQAGLDERAQA